MSHTLQYNVPGVVLLIVLAVLISTVLWWGTRLPPTRPRPDSRYRGRTFMSVHRRLQKRRRDR
ncbi:MAG: hypothetical protein JOZ75_08785 [Candidatus Dormibacteraeota bacterium]|nr:hypothetical protein [Candidatus Dormibacteraeota bacterium]